MKGLNELEQAVLDKLIAGNHPALHNLRTQANVAKMIERELTGCGFYVNFEVPVNIPALKGNFQICDVNGEMEGLLFGAGFVLFIRNGYLDLLEGFSYDEPWPEHIGKFTLSYLKEPRELSFLSQRKIYI